jgi:hypothetical protein
MMIETEATAILEKLDALRIELVELAFVLDRRGRPDAADVANLTVARLNEICAEFREPSERATLNDDESSEG